MKKLLSVICMSAVFSLSAAVLSFADQTDRWHSDSNGTWYLYNEAKTSNVVNSWFQDLDGAWYLLAPGDGHMYAGLIHDTLTDRWYFCQTEHDGWYGRMAHTDGSYTVNGQSVYLTFNQQHDGTFGAILSGLENLQSTGIPTQDINGIPEASASAHSTLDNEYQNAIQGVNGESIPFDPDESMIYGNRNRDPYSGMLRDGKTNADYWAKNEYYSVDSVVERILPKVLEAHGWDYDEYYDELGDHGYNNLGDALKDTIRNSYNFWLETADEETKSTEHSVSQYRDVVDQGWYPCIEAYLEYSVTEQLSNYTYNGPYIVGRGGGWSR